MPDTISVPVDTLDFQRVDGPNSPPPCPVLSEPLEVIKRALESIEETKLEFLGYLLSRLVVARLELDNTDVARLPEILDVDVLRSELGILRPFDARFRYMIRRYDLGALFNSAASDQRHRRPRQYGSFASTAARR